MIEEWNEELFPAVDRFAEMAWDHGDRPCPTCGSRPDSIPTYRPTDPKPVSDEARAAHLRFAEKRTPDGGAR